MRGTEFRKIVPAAASRYKRMTHVLRFGRERHGRGGDEGKDVIRENWKSSELSEKTSVTDSFSGRPKSKPPPSPHNDGQREGWMREGRSVMRGRSNY